MTYGANLLPNPGAEADAAGWSTQNATLARVTTPVRSGVGAFSLTAAAAGDVTMVAAELSSGLNPGQLVLLSAYGRSAAAGRTVQMLVDWSSATAYLSTASVSGPTTTTTGWTQTTGSVLMPATATRGTVFLRFYAAAAGEVHYADDLSVQADTPAPVNAGPNTSGAPGTTATRIGTPPGGTWTQESGPAVTLSAPVTTTQDTRVTFVRDNPSTTAPVDRLFRYTAP